MTVDIASLALQVDSTQVEKGAVALNALQEAGKAAEKQAAANAAANKALAEATARSAEQGKAFATGLERQAALHGKSASDALRYDAALLTLSKSERERVNGLINTIAKQEQSSEAMRVNAEQAKYLAVAVTAAATAFVMLVRSTINSADAMNDLHIKTGLAFRDLAAYDLLARQSGTTIQGIEQAFKFLGKSMTENRSELAAIGVTSTDTNVAMGQFADLISSIEDRALRTTLQMKYLGRGGTEVGVALAGGAAAFEKARKESTAYGDSLERTAPAADEFNDKMAKLQIQIGSVAQELVIDLLPLLSELADNSLTAADDVGKMDDSFSPLIEALRAAIIFGGNVAYVFRAIGIEAGGLAAQVAALARGDFAGFKAIGEAMKEDAEKNRAALDEWEKKIMAAGKAAKTSAEDAAGGVKKLTKAEEDAIRTSEERAKAAKKAADEAAKSAEEFKKHAEAIKADTNQLGFNEIQQRMLAEAAYAMTLTSDKQRMVVMENAAAWAMKKQATDEEAEAVKKAADAYAEWEKASDAARKSIDSSIRSIEEKASAMEAEVRNYGLMQSQIEAATVTRLEERRAIDAGIDGMEDSVAALDKEIAARKRLVAASGSKEALDANKKATEEMERDWKKMHEQISQSLTDAIMNGGQDAGELLKNYFKTLVLRPIISGAVNVGMNAVGSALGFGESGSSGGGGMNLLSTGSSLYNAATGGGIFGSIGGFGAGAASAASELALGASFVGPSASLAGGAVGAGATAGLSAGASGASALSGLAAAAPWVAGGLAIASIFGGDLFGKKKPAPIEWGLVDLPRGPNPQQYYGSQASLAPWAQYMEHGPFGTLLTTGQHLSRNGMSAGALQSQVTSPLIQLDKVLGGYLSEKEKNKISMALYNGREGEHGWNQGEVEGVMMRRLDRISNAIGGWVDKLADSTTGNLQERYTQLAQILSIRGDEFFEKLARDMFKAYGNSFDFKKFSALSAGVTTFKDLFYTDSEKFDDGSAKIHKALADLNVEFPESRSAFRDMVEGLDRSTKSEFKKYEALIALAPAMDSYYKGLEDELKVKRQLSAMNQNNFATKVDYTRYQRVAENYDDTFAGNYAYNINRGAIKPGAANVNGDIVAAIKQLESKSEAQNVASIMAQQETARLLRRWNGDGMPETRTVV